MNNLTRTLSLLTVPLLAGTPAFASNARLRVVHASPDAPDVDVLVDGAAAFTDVTFTAVSDYASLAPETYAVQVVPAGLTEPVVIDATLALAPLTEYTVVALNTLDAIEPIVLIDDNTLDADEARVRFVHASPDAPAVDIALADGGPVLFGDIEFKEVGDYLSVPPATYDLEVRLSGTDSVVLPLPGIVLTEQRVYTVFAMGFAGGSPGLTAIMSEDAVAFSNVRVVHASPDAPPVDVLVDDAPAFTALAFSEFTDYAGLPFGTYNVKVVPSGLTDPIVIEADLPLDPQQDYTVLAVNTLAKIQPLVLLDDNSTSLTDARIRFVHASPNAPAVDIALADGGPVLFGDIEFTEVGAYIAVPPGTYDLEARLAGTDTVVLPIPGVAVRADTVYTAYAIGLVGMEPPLSAIISVDNAFCRGDVTDDGNVGLEDLLHLLSSWGDSSGPFDLDEDGTVGFFDLLILLSTWGACPA